MRVGNELLDDVPDGVTSVAMTLTWFMMSAQLASSY
jgi:hypothetical protein